MQEQTNYMRVSFWFLTKLLAPEPVKLACHSWHGDATVCGPYHASSLCRIQPQPDFYSRHSFGLALYRHSLD